MDYNIRFRASGADVPEPSAHEEDENVIAGGETVPPPAPPEPPDATDYLDRIRLYVPTETLGAYLLLDGLALQVWDDDRNSLRYGLLVVAVVLAFLTAVIAKNVLKVAKRPQRAVSVIAFLLWVGSTGHLMETFDWWEPSFATFAIVIFGVIAFAYRFKSLPAQR